MPVVRSPHSDGSRCPRCPILYRGSSWEKEKFPRQTLEQSGGRCVVCGGRDRVQAHHLWPLSEGGTDADGGKALCWTHHQLAHARTS
jgi:5-methylcytosine-specific restriction endonuclease McrA